MSTTEPLRGMLLAHMQGCILYKNPFTCEYINPMKFLNVQQIPRIENFTKNGERVLTMRKGRTEYKDCQLDKIYGNQTNGYVISEYVLTQLDEWYWYNSSCSNYLKIRHMVNPTVGSVTT